MFTFTYLMKSMWKYEIKKLFMQRNHAIFLIALVMLANILFFYQIQNDGIPPQEYVKIQQKLESVSHEEREASLQELEDRNALIMGKDSPNWDVQKTIDHYGKAWVDEVLKNEEVLPETVIQRCRAEEANLMSYDQFLEGVLQQYERNTTISIFQKGDGFVISRGEQTKALYEGLSVTMPASSTGTYGVEKVLQSKISEILILAAIFYFFYELVASEDEHGLLKYCSMMKKSTGKQLLVKWLTLLCMTSVMQVVMLVTMMMVSMLCYGAVDVSSAIQSVWNYVSVPYEMTIFGFFLLVFLCRMIVYGLLTALLFALDTLCRRYLPTVLLFTGIILTGMLLSAKSVDSHLFSFLGIFDLLHPEYTIKEVSFIRMGTQAISYWYLYPIMLLIMGILLWITMRWFRFHKRSVRNMTKVHNHQPHGLWFYEGKKLWFHHGGIVLMILLFGMQFSMIYQVKSMSSSDDLKYNYYIDTFGREVNEITEQKIVAEKQRFDNIRSQMSLEQDRGKLNELIRQSAMESGFQQYVMRYEQVKADERTRNLIKEGQVRFLIDNDSFQSRLLFFLVLFAVLLCELCYDREHSSNVLLIQRMCDHVTSRVGRMKAIHAGIGAELGVLVMNLAMWFHNGQMYPTADYHDRLCDSMVYGAAQHTLSIGMVLFLQLLWQMFIMGLLIALLLKLYQRISYSKLVLVVLVLLSMTLLLKETVFDDFVILYDLFYPWQNVFTAIWMGIVLLILVCIIYRYDRRCQR